RYKRRMDYDGPAAVLGTGICAYTVVRLGGSLLSPKAHGVSVSRLPAYAAADSARCPAPLAGGALTRTGRRRGHVVTTRPAVGTRARRAARPRRDRAGAAPGAPGRHRNVGAGKSRGNGRSNQSLEQTGRAIPAHTGYQREPAR